MARSAVYSLLSLGVKDIVICNRTTKHATALAGHYNELIQAGSVPGLDSDQSKPHIHVLPAISSSWPEDLRQPTMIISGIPRQEAGQPPVNFSLPDSWLKSSTGGIVLEVSRDMLEMRRHTNDAIACLSPGCLNAGWTGRYQSAARMDIYGWH